jgi:hypothetical protein
MTEQNAIKLGLNPKNGMVKIPYNGGNDRTFNFQTEGGQIIVKNKATIIAEIKNMAIDTDENTNTEMRIDYMFLLKVGKYNIFVENGNYDYE